MPAVTTGPADARLISAAPDLLAACVELLDAYTPTPLHEAPGVVERARAAIAKATRGE